MTDMDERLTELEQRVESLERDNIRLIRRVSALENGAVSMEKEIPETKTPPGELSQSLPYRTSQKIPPQSS